jgi:hypothetical protein
MANDNSPKWAAIVDDRLVPMPRRRLKARDILHQGSVPPGRSLVRDYNSPNDIAFDPDAEIDLAEGNVFRAAEGCQQSRQITCEAPAKLAFVVDDRWEVTIQPKQSGETLRGLFNLPQNTELLRDHESPRDEEIGDDERFTFADGPVFITRKAEVRDTTIIVNGRPKTVTGKTVSFEQIVALAYNPVRSEPFILYTVQYSRGPRANPEGELLAGQQVKIKDRMVFLVTETDKS